MRIQVVSDLHIDFDDLYKIENKKNADILVIAGDTGEWGYSQSNILKLLSDASEQYEQTFMVLGNHEYYSNGPMKQTQEEILELNNFYDNVKILENDCVEIGEYLFIGATLWTDLNEGHGVAKHLCVNFMNDFKQIEGFTVNDWLREHFISKDYIEQTILQNPHLKKIVITHHSPSMDLVHEYYKSSKDLNYSFHCTNLDHLLHENELIWIFGHTHYSDVMNVGKSKCVVNAKGYGYENRDFAPNLILDI